jgi:hypothetical protein
LIIPLIIAFGDFAGGGGGCSCTPCDENKTYGHCHTSTGTNALKITLHGVCFNRPDPCGWSLSAISVRAASKQLVSGLSSTYGNTSAVMIMVQKRHIPPLVGEDPC